MGLLAPVGSLRTRDPAGWRCPRACPVSPGARVLYKHARPGDGIALTPPLPPDLFVARHADHHVGGTVLDRASLPEEVRQRVDPTFIARPAPAFPCLCCTALLIFFPLPLLCSCFTFRLQRFRLKSEEEGP